MADLELRFSDSNGDDLPSGGADLLARIRRIGSSKERSLAVHVGYRNLVEGLEAGDYEVRLHMPSGKVIVQRVLIDASGGKVVLEAGSLWDTRASRRRAGVRLGRSSAPTPSSEPRSSSKQMGSNSADEDAPDFFGAAGGAEGVHQPFTIMMVEASVRLEGPDPDEAQILSSWERYGDGARGIVAPAPMVGGTLRTARMSVPGQPGYVAYRLGYTAVSQDSRYPPRPFALVVLEGRNELVSLPLPWRRDREASVWDRNEVIDLVVDKTSRPQETRSSVTVRDGRYGGPLAYMNNGAFAQAGELLGVSANAGEQARGLACATDSPLGECALIYVLLSTNPLDEESELGAWRSLAWRLGAAVEFEWVPDAFILAARLVLMTAATAEEARTALPLIKSALRLGLPFYSLGLTWLFEAMALFDEDPLIKAVSPQVDRVARRLDVSQAFLVLNLEQKGT